MSENIVKRVCSELGITQRELAERLGVHLVVVKFGKFVVKSQKG